MRLAIVWLIDSRCRAWWSTVPDGTRVLHPLSSCGTRVRCVRWGMLCYGTLGRTFVVSVMVIHHIDAHVHDDRAGLHPVPLDEVRMAHSDDQDVCAACQRWQVKVQACRGSERVGPS